MPKNEIAELKQQVSLRDVVAGRVQLEARGGEWWGICPFHSENTASFAVKKKDGEEVFFCQGCGKGGDVITFIELSEQISNKEAIAKLRSLAGNEEWKEQARKVQAAFPAVVDKPRQSLPVAAWPAKEAALLNCPEALKYLLDVRGITVETAKALRLGFVQSTKGNIGEANEPIRDKGWICFPRIVGDKIVAVKMRSIVAKAFTQLSGMDPKALFNTDTITPFAPVFVTEGEYDTAIMEQAGFAAVSIPNANSKLTPEWKILLKNASYVVLAGDNDGKVGSDAMQVLFRELGENTYLLLWPGVKDANEFFLKTCEQNIDVFRQKVNELVEAAKSTPVEGFTSLVQRLRTSGGTDGENDRFRLHFNIPELDRMAYVPLDAGYVIFYSTYSGTGKSVFTTQIVIEEARRGEAVVVYSPELSGAPYLALVAAQTLPHKDINRSLVVSQADYLETADVLDQPTSSGAPFQYYLGHILPDGDPLEFIESVLKVIRPTRFVVDTFPCVVVRGRGESMVEAESRTAETLSALGKKYGCIFIVVGQSNKEAEDIKEKRKDSHGVLRGSRVLWDKAHAIFLLHRKKKEDGTGQDDLLETTTLVKMEKNRTSGPGSQQILLQYVRTKSRFFLQDRGNGGNISNASSPPDPAAYHDGIF